jgi:hypothetical protein
MRLFSVISKVIDTIIDEVNTPESFKVGETFEDYVRKFIFPERDYTLLDRTHNYASNSKDYIESSLKPDFKFRDKYSQKEFYVEAKFRSNINNEKVVWCTQRQLIRYQECNKETPVFIILGIGGEPDYPRFISLLPLSAARYCGLYTSVIDKFDIEPGKTVSSRMLWRR